MIKLVIFDMDGVLRVGSKILDNVNETLTFLKNNKIPYCINTNECRYDVNELKEDLEEYGLYMEEDTFIYTSSMAVRDYLKNKILRFPNKKFILSIVGESGLYNCINELCEYNNVKITDNLKNIDLNDSIDLSNSASSSDFNTLNPLNNIETVKYLIIGTVNKIKITHLEKVLKSIKNNAKVITTCGDACDPSSKGDFVLGMPNHLLHMVGYNVTAKNYSLGKPHPIHANKILEHYSKFGIKNEEIMFVGDTIYTDIRLAEEHNFKSTLVLTGNTKKEAFKYYVTEPDYIISNLGELMNIIKVENKIDF